MIDSIRELASQSAAESKAASAAVGDASLASFEASKAAGEASKAAAIMAVEIRNIASNILEIKKSVDDFHCEMRPAMSKLQTDVAIIQTGCPNHVTQTQRGELMARINILETARIEAEEARKEAAARVEVIRRGRTLTPHDKWYLAITLIGGWAALIWMAIRSFWTTHVIRLLGGK